MKHLKKYNESVDKKLDKNFFEILFAELVDSGVVLNIRDDYNFFRDFYNDGRKGTEGGVLISFKALPSSNYIENHIKQIDKYKEIMIDIEVCIKRIGDELPGVEHYIEFVDPRTELVGNVLVYFWYPTIYESPGTKFTKVK